MTQNSFAALNLPHDLLHNLKSMGYTSMTPIQAQSLPAILNGKDVIGQAKTGSGKTAAFGLGLLQKLDVKRFSVQALVLCPTRELADQVAQEIRKLGRAIANVKVLTLCGGSPFGPQVGSLEHGAHIIVGTPGRVEEHLRKGTVRLDNLSTFVLDEADRMLDMGFQPSLDAIMASLPSQRQTLLFSATFPEQIQAISQRVMQQPVLIQAESQHDDTSITQIFYQLQDHQSRKLGLQSLLLEYRPSSTLVFCNTKRETQEVADHLRQAGFSALALHGDLDQKQRDQTLVIFAGKGASILVATDVAARGLDIDALDMVVNYQLARETEVHVHRVGRTGRAGSTGIACTLLEEKEQFKLRRLEEHLNQVIHTQPLPETDLRQPPFKPAMTLLQIGGGKKQKVRAGDILGALTGEHGIAGDEVGKITILENTAFVAVKRAAGPTALNKIANGKLKGRTMRVRQL